MADEDHWTVQLRYAERALRAMEERLGSVLKSDRELRDASPEAELAVKEFRSLFEMTRAWVQQLEQRLVVLPLMCVSKAALLTREQYLLLSAAGLELFTHKNVGLSAFDNFELAQMFFYEDDDRYSVINPGRQPDELLRVHVGTCPEDIEFDRLRPEQQHFFETYLPEVAARFKRTADLHAQDMATGAPGPRAEPRQPPYLSREAERKIIDAMVKLYG